MRENRKNEMIHTQQKYFPCSQVQFLKQVNLHQAFSFSCLHYPLIKFRNRVIENKEEKKKRRSKRKSIYNLNTRFDNSF
jgi:hypothetical protein